MTQTKTPPTLTPEELEAVTGGHKQQARVARKHRRGYGSGGHSN